MGCDPRVRDLVGRAVSCVREGISCLEIYLKIPRVLCCCPGTCTCRTVGVHMHRISLQYAIVSWHGGPVFWTTFVWAFLNDEKLYLQQRQKCGCIVQVEKAVDCRKLV